MTLRGAREGPFRRHVNSRSAMRMFDAIGYWFRNGLQDAWNWVCALSPQEWFLLLGITAAAGFMCMRGFGSRTNY
jgi:hypothetical protein